MMIQVENVTKYFGPVLAVDNINFEVDRGEIVGLLGLNGAGKTTTMRILTTFLPATYGIAKVAGFDVMTQSLDVRRSIGYLPESVPLYPEMRVEEYLDYRAKLKDVDRKTRIQRIGEVLERCRLREVRRRLLGTLSKGYRQRVGLADALIHNPPLLILDEPTSGLDPIQIRETLATIRDLRQEHTVLLSTHILTEVEAVCERVIIINHGRVGLDKQMSDLDTEAPVIVMEVRGPVDQVANALRTAEGVAEVHSQPVEEGVASFELRTTQGQDLREVLAQRVSNNGWTLRRLDLRRRRLEDHFMDVVVRAQNTFAAHAATRSVADNRPLIENKPPVTAIKTHPDVPVPAGDKPAVEDKPVVESKSVAETKTHPDPKGKPPERSKQGGKKGKRR